jgi:hypothetical protein
VSAAALRAEATNGSTEVALLYGGDTSSADAHGAQIAFTNEGCVSPRRQCVDALNPLRLKQATTASADPAAGAADSVAKRLGPVRRPRAMPQRSLGYAFQPMNRPNQEHYTSAVQRLGHFGKTRNNDCQSPRTGLCLQKSRRPTRAICGATDHRSRSLKLRSARTRSVPIRPMDRGQLMLCCSMPKVDLP